MMRGLWETGVHRPTDVLVRNPAATAAVERWVLKRIDHVLVVVEESGERLRALGVPDECVTVVSNTPSLSRLRELSPRVHMQGKPIELIYLGLLFSCSSADAITSSLGMSGSAGTEKHVDLPRAETRRTKL